MPFGADDYSDLVSTLSSFLLFCDSYSCFIHVVAILHFRFFECVASAKMGQWLGALWIEYCGRLCRGSYFLLDYLFSAYIEHLSGV